MSFLKAIAKKQSDISIKSLIHARVGGMSAARSNNPLHASDLTKDPEFCPREVVLFDVLKVKRREEYISSELRITFDEGIDKQARLNNHYLRDIMVGHWECLGCGELRKFSAYPKNGCKLGHNRWEYREVMFHHAKTKFTGSVDSLLNVSQPLLRMVEIKIMAQDQWMALKAPLAEHKLRTNLYLRLIEESVEEGWAKCINTKVSHVIYWLRGYGRKGEDGKISPFKEYVIHRDDAVTDYLFTRAGLVNDYRENKKMHHTTVLSTHMPKGICGTAMCPRALKCSVRPECFSGSFPGVVG